MSRGTLTMLTLSLLVLVLTVQTQSEALLRDRLILRRQIESEQESTTAKSQGQEPQAATASQTNNAGSGGGGNGQQQPPRLYPDLAHVPVAAFAPIAPPAIAVPQPFPPTGGVAAPFAPHYPPNHHGPQTPFVPFGMQLPTNRLSALQQRLQPRPMQSAAERLQSETFTHGLGRRLLSMIGLDMSAPANETGEASGAEGRSNEADSSGTAMDPMKALQNATVLQQLNRGVQSIYGGLSKMYNSTVQQQLNLLQERFKKETENSTSPWQQRMAQQVPMFFKSMAMKVEEAQSNLNRIWRQVSQASNGSLAGNGAANGQPQFVAERRLQPAPFAAFGPDADQMMGTDGLQPLGGGNFFNQIGRQFGFGGQNGGQPQQADLGSQLMGFWHNQVQPQIGMVRSQVARVWRDLTASGVYPMDPMMVRSRQNNNNLGSKANESANSDIVDDILKSVDMGSNSEYTLIEPSSTADQQQAGSNNEPEKQKLQQQQQQQQQQQANSKASELSAQFQNRLVSMQRELNQLWSGLSSSIQGALGNVKSALNPRPQQFGGPLEPMASDANGQAADPAQNEIEDKIKDLGKLQRDADVVYDTIQKQQQAQQRPSFTDRFKNFIGNVDFGNVDQLSDRIGESMSRFGTAVGDLWHQIPTRWENFMQNVRQPGDQASTMTNVRRLTSSSSASTTQKPMSTSPATGDSP